MKNRTVLNQFQHGIAWCRLFTQRILRIRRENKLSFMFGIRSLKLERVLFVVVLIGSFVGCSNGTTPAPDPFFGRMTIAPPSTQSGTTSAASSYSTPSYTPPAVVAAPVSPSSTQAWQSPPQPNFGQTASVSPPYGSESSVSQPSTSQPSRPIYLNQSAIEDSVRQPSYTSNNTSSYAASSQNVAAAGSSRATGSTRAASPLNIYPAPDVQAVNGQPVRERKRYLLPIG